MTAAPPLDKTEFAASSGKLVTRPRVSRFRNWTFVLLFLLLLGLFPPRLRADSSPSVAEPEKISRIHTQKSYSVVCEQLRLLWKSTLERSVELQVLIKERYPNLTKDEHEKLLDVVEDVNTIRGSSSCAGVLALTEPNLEPSYPVTGGQAPAFRLPELMKKHSTLLATGETGVSEHRRLPRLESRLSNTAQELFRCYTNYCSKCEALAMMNTSDKLFTESLKRSCDSSRVTLVQLAGLEAVEQIDRELGIIWKSSPDKERL